MALLAAALAGACGGAPARLLPAPTERLVDPLAPGRRTDVAVPVLSYAWRRNLDHQAGAHRPQEFASAAAYAEHVYVGSRGGNLYALRADDGSVVWESSIGAVSSRPLILGGLVFVGTDDGVLVALDLQSGRERWRYATKGPILHAPVPVGDTIVFANAADNVYALDRDTGKWRWQYDRDTPEEFTVRGHAGVAFDGERVFAGFSDGHLVALTATGGEVVWVRSLAGDAKQFVDVDATPVVSGGVLYASSVSGGLFAMTASDGTERWRFAVQGAGSVAVGGGHVYFAAADEGLFALDTAGHLVWRQGLAGAGDPAAPVVEGDLLFLSLADRGLMVVDRRTGALLQSFDPGPGVSSPPAIAGDRIYVLSNGGILYAMALVR